MTDDRNDSVTRGLALLADEAEPAPVDTHTVIARARARTRNRRATAAAFAAVVAIAVLAVAGGAGPPPAAETATSQESAEDRLTAQLWSKVRDVVPARWVVAPPPRPDDYAAASPLRFSCHSTTLPQDPGTITRTLQLPGEHVELPFRPGHDRCFAEGYFRDTESSIELSLWVEQNGGRVVVPCTLPGCDESPLRDGTLLRLDSDNLGVRSEGRSQEFEAMRPDGTYLMAAVRWHDDRSTPPLTLDEIEKIATAFTY